MRPKRILIVDDDLATRLLLRAVLGAQGYDVLEADNAQQATACAFWDHPDAVVLDLMLPGTDGLEVCRTLRREPETASLPVLVITARPDLKEQAMEAGANALLAKPWDVEELLVHLKQFMGVASERGGPGE